MARLKLFLTALVRIFRFVEKRRQREFAAKVDQAATAIELRAERERERAHQTHIIELLATKLVEFAKANQEGILKLAEAQTAQANVLAEWMKGFQGSSAPLEAMPAKDDEWENPYGLTEPTPDVVSQLPPEFRLAFSLQNDPNPDFDREGRDNI